MVVNNVMLVKEVDSSRKFIGRMCMVFICWVKWVRGSWRVIINSEVSIKSGVRFCLWLLECWIFIGRVRYSWL